MTTANAYEQVMEVLGHPGSARLRLILKHLMSEDQARMVLALPGTPAEVAEKTGLDERRVKDSLEELFSNGSVVPRGDLVRRSATGSTLP